MLEKDGHQGNWSNFLTTILRFYPQSLSNDQHKPLFCHRFPIFINTPEYCIRAQRPLKTLGPGNTSYRFAIEDPMPQFNLWQIRLRIQSLWRLCISQILTRLLLTIPPLTNILLEPSLNIRLTEVFLAKTSEYSMSPSRAP